ncbi:hypothetical protein BAE46_06945 [Glaciecola punicea]|uniref:AlkA N-terminal domain-containing protein n=1 Tax=Glaciecola punicea TaxID=56804 RepID=UPI0008722C83|nr:AlkA N-terminal domain-containing protein [Glaciecola punicea]OFA31972.1 hypothetical protein BAE46_06945 [Glaciecola punicea]
MSILLTYRPPYNWPQLRDFLAKRQIHGNEQVHENGLSKILSVADKRGDGSNEYVPIKVDITHAAKQNGFYLTFNAAHSRHTLSITNTIRRMLDLDINPQLIETGLRNAGLPENEIVSGLRIPGVASGFEAGCRAILGQQVSVTAAVNKVNQLHAFFAEQNGVYDLVFRFPTPDEVASNDLLFLKMPAARRQSLISLGKFYQHCEPLAALENDEPSDTAGLTNTAELTNTAGLINIKGIGPWTVNYVLLRAIGESDIWLDTDLVIKQQLAKRREQGRAINAELAAPWRSYLTLNLWRLAG